MPQPTGPSAIVPRPETAIIARAMKENAARMRPANRAGMMTGHHVAHALTEAMLHHQHRAGGTVSKAGIVPRPIGTSAKAGRSAHHARGMAKAVSGHAARGGLPAQVVPLTTSHVHSATSHVREGLLASLVVVLVADPARAEMAHPEVARHAVALLQVAPRASPETRQGR